MKKQIIISLCLGAMALFSTPALAQNQTVKGTVTDDKGEPIIGASVMVAGEKGKGTVTDLDGNYTLQIVHILFCFWEGDKLAELAFCTYKQDARQGCNIGNKQAGEQTFSAAAFNFKFTEECFLSFKNFLSAANFNLADSVNNLTFCVLLQILSYKFTRFAAGNIAARKKNLVSNFLYVQIRNT